MTTAFVRICSAPDSLPGKVGGGKKVKLVVYKTSSKEESRYPISGEIKKITRQIVREMRNKRGYGFLSEEDFVTRVYTQALQNDKCYRAAQKGSDLTGPISRLAKNIYSKAIYGGCRSNHAEVQNRAYKELGYYLYRVAYNVVAPKGCSAYLAEECTQQALMQLHSHIENVREPGGFLAFAITTTKRICFRAVEKAIKRGDCEENPVKDEPSIFEMVTTENPKTTALLDCLLEAIARLANKDMRMVLILEHFAGLDNNRIALILDQQKNNIFKLRHDAKKKLKTDQILRECVQDA